MLSKLFGGLAGVAFTSSVVFFRGLIAPDAVQRPAVALDIQPVASVVQNDESELTKAKVRALSEGFSFSDLVSSDAGESIEFFPSGEQGGSVDEASVASHESSDELWGSLLAKIEAFDPGPSSESTEETTDWPQRDWSKGDAIASSSFNPNRRIASAAADGGSRPSFPWDQLGISELGTTPLNRERSFRAIAPGLPAGSRLTDSRSGGRFGQAAAGGGGQAGFGRRAAVSPATGGAFPNLGGLGGSSGAQSGTTGSSVASSSGNSAAVSRVFDSVASSSRIASASAPVPSSVGSTVSSPSIDQVADSGRPQLTADGKFGIPNHQYWTLDFEEARLDDGLVTREDADFQFNRYVTETLPPLLDAANQVVKFSPVELQGIYQDLNNQIPQTDSAKSPDFLTFMIIDFPIKGFYLPEAEIPANPSLPAGAVD